MSAELVVLVDEAGNAVGSAPKATAHHTRTPLHLAFSCYVFDDAGRLLVTQRALDKATFPGVWTNSFCGHPAPGEDLVEAVTRRAEQELGLSLTSLTLVLPAFRYEATGDNGVRENELCPVFTAVAASDPVPAAAEVAEVAWVPWALFRDEVLAGERQVSVWCAQQVAELAGREASDGGFVAAPLDELPPAARPVRS
ncbi:isopentenyl-diphosphate Delta-isomerase [Nocardioides sp. SYSU DS0651]|uniref:isopentenyl-diphosphate Delta-isomerase n=1 Tax=Nocardioides sp. SYSU DS0651 TaxID=3415955 RepID=UPI003F4C0B72